MTQKSKSTPVEEEALCRIATHDALVVWPVDRPFHMGSGGDVSSRLCFGPLCKTARISNILNERHIVQMLRITVNHSRGFTRFGVEGSLTEPRRKS
jgi:hypothetical protein